MDAVRAGWRVGPGPNLSSQLTHADFFEPAESEIVLKWDGTEPGPQMPMEEP